MPNETNEPATASHQPLDDSTEPSVPPGARTSLTHPLQIATLGLPGGGRIGVTFCPGKQGDSVFGQPWHRDLRLDLQAVLDWGAMTLVTLVEHHELELLRVRHLGQLAGEMGLQWHHLPIPDLCAPGAEFEESWRRTAPELVSQLKSGHSVVVHCRGGRGRAGTVAALLLRECGWETAAAIHAVRSVRPGAIETRSQEQYLSKYQRVCPAPGHGSAR